MNTVIVTRHTGLVEWLKRRGIEGEVVAHADEATVKDKHVYGVLPFRLAALAGRFTEVSLQLPEEMRGKELTADDVDALNPQMTDWVVGKAAETEKSFCGYEIHNLKDLVNHLRSFRISMEKEAKKDDEKAQPEVSRISRCYAGGAAWAIEFVKALFVLDDEDECAKCRHCLEHKTCRLLEAQ